MNIFPFQPYVKPTISFFKLLKALRLIDFHAAVFALPAVKRLFGNVMLTDNIRRSFSALVLFQNLDYLLVCESCFYVNPVPL